MKKAAVAKAKEERATWRERKEAGDNTESPSDEEEGEEAEVDHTGDVIMGSQADSTANPPLPPPPTAHVNPANVPIPMTDNAPLEDEPMGNPQVAAVIIEPTTPGPSNRENTQPQC
jgi:hypothetical protein